MASSILMGINNYLNNWIMKDFFVKIVSSLQKVIRALIKEIIINLKS